MRFMVPVRRVILLALIMGLFSPAFAENNADTISYKLVVIEKDATRQIDLMDVLHSLFRTGFSSPAKNDSVSLKPVMSVVPAIGYALQSRMAVLLSGNVAFRTSPQSRVSLINFSTSYTQNAQFTLPCYGIYGTKTTAIILLAS
jgi:hypothetical protein